MNNLKVNLVSRDLFKNIVSTDRGTCVNIFSEMIKKREKKERRKKYGESFKMIQSVTLDTSLDDKV